MADDPIVELMIQPVREILEKAIHSGLAQEVAQEIVTKQLAALTKRRH